MPIYFVEGNIGTGKSTFLSMVEKVCPGDNQVIYEPVDIWTSLKDKEGVNVLQHFYNDPRRYAYTFQSLAFISRMEKLDDIDFSKKNVFIERSIWSDCNVFARNCLLQSTLSEMEFELYSRWFSWAERQVKLDSSIHVYLRCSPETSFARTRTRNRAEESGIPLSYISQIHDRHEEWVSAGNRRFIEIDASVDFKQEDVFKQIFNTIVNHPVN